MLYMRFSVFVCMDANIVIEWIAIGTRLILFSDAPRIRIALHQTSVSSAS